MATMPPPPPGAPEPAPGMPPPPGYGAMPPQGYGAPPPPGYGAMPPPGYGAMPPPGYGPQGMGPRFAGFWIRFVAVFIDGIITGIVAGGIGFSLLKAANIVCYSQDPITGQLSNCTTDNPSLVVLAFVIWIGLPFMYMWIMWGLGGTIGQRALGMRVVDATTGQKIGIVRGFVRLLGYIIASIPFALGLMWAGWDPRKQGWHDKIASTVVLRG